MGDSPSGGAAGGVRGRRGLLALAVAAAVAALLRAAGHELVFLDDGTVVFTLGDAEYHARLAHYAWAQAPRFLAFDRYLNFPHGAWVPYPPLHDWLPGLLVRGLGGGEAALERAVAWAPVLYGAASVLPIAALGRRLGGPPVALGAALLYAVSPLPTLAGSVGNADHHAAVGLLGALLVWLYVRVLDAPPGAPGREPEPGAAAWLALAACRAALLGVWQGSLLYLVPGELALLAAGVATRRAALLRGTGWSALLSAALVSPLVLATGRALGGPFSSIELSYLHLVVLLGTGVLALGLVGVVAPAPNAGPGAAGPGAWRPAPWRRLAWLAAPALLVAGVAAVAVAPGVLQGLAFLSKADAYPVMEQAPLWPFGRPGAGAGARAVLGAYVYLLPLVPAVFLLAPGSGGPAGRGGRAGRAIRPWRAPARLYLCVWSALTGGLALAQMRFANDFLPVGCVAFAWLLAIGVRAAQRRWPGPRRARGFGWVGGALGLLLMVPALRYHLPILTATARHHLAERPGGDRALASVGGSLVRFAQQLRRATPQTAGFLDPTEPPEYSVLAWVGLGHALQYHARRPTPADSFGPYIGPEQFRLVQGFFQLRDEGRALAVASRLGARFVVTHEGGGPRAPGLLHRLHRADGSAVAGLPRLERFRLVTEGPSGGVGLAALLGRRAPAGSPPYKLFEIVPGARLSLHGPPGEPVVAEVAVRAPGGRRFRYRAGGRLDARGRGELRVPYSTDGRLPARVEGPWRVRAGGRERALRVPEAAVRGGSEVRVDLGGGG